MAVKDVRNGDSSLIHSNIVRCVTLVVQALSSYDDVPEQDDAVFVFRFHWVLPCVNVGDVICGDVG